MALAFVVSLASVTITDINKLDGSILQRLAAAFNLIVYAPSNVLPPIRNDIEGPVHQMFTTIFWGLLIGEALNLRRKQIKKDREPSAGPYGSPGAGSPSGQP